MTDARSVQIALWKAQRRQLTFRMTGTCMQPTLCPSDQVTLEACSPAEFTAGDIVVFDNGQMWLAHRLIAVGRSGIMTKPDSREDFDPPTAWARVVGRVVRATCPDGSPRDLSYRADGASDDIPGPGRKTVACMAQVAGPWALELGTGSGQTAAEIAATGCCVVAVDRSPRALGEARRLSPGGLGVLFMQADATRLPFADDSFDSVTLYQALHHFNKPWEALDEAHRVLRPGGLIIAVEHQGLMRRLLAAFTSLEVTGNPHLNHPLGNFAVDQLLREIQGRFLTNRVISYKHELLIVARKTQGFPRASEGQVSD